MKDEVVVELRKVSKRFGEVLALEDVNLEIKDGEFFSLLGPSGCGKTTSLRLIAGFEMPSEGEVWIDGRLQGETPAYKRPVNTVFQNYALFPHMTVFQNIAFGLEMQKLPAPEIKRRVGKALEMVRLPGMEARKPKQLSGGQQQRVALARALVNRPKVLLLDEPLGALDLKLRKAMQLELKALQNQVGITFIYVTHDQEEALTMSDRIAVMDHGRVLQVGSPSEIYERPTNQFVADFIGESNLIPAEVVALHSVTVEVALGGKDLVLAPQSHNFSLGQQVTLALRPERVRFDQEGAGANRLPAEVVEIFYTGATTSYLLRLDSGLTMTMRQPNLEREGERSAKPGERVIVSWLVEAATIFLEDQERESTR